MNFMRKNTLKYLRKFVKGKSPEDKVPWALYKINPILTHLKLGLPISIEIIHVSTRKPKINFFESLIYFTYLIIY